MIENIEQTMRTLKLGGLAKEWRNVVYQDSEQYMRDLLDIEVANGEKRKRIKVRACSCQHLCLCKQGFVVGGVDFRQLRSTILLEQRANFSGMSVSGFIR